MLVADLTYMQLPLERCTPRCPRDAARPWSAAAMSARCHVQTVLVADLTYTQLPGMLHAVLLRNRDTDVGCGCHRCSVLHYGAGRGPDLPQLSLERCTLSSSGAAARPWAVAATVAQCELRVLAADLAYTELPLERCAPFR